jgi:hypothetical protein
MAVATSQSTNLAKSRNEIRYRGIQRLSKRDSNHGCNPNLQSVWT